jgi:hypothetical protein
MDGFPVQNFQGPNFKEIVLQNLNVIFFFSVPPFGRLNVIIDLVQCKSNDAQTQIALSRRF